MVRLKSIPEEDLIKILAGVFHQPTTSDTYVYINTLLEILPVKETVQEFYCIFSALESLYEIYGIRGTIPVINRDVLVSIVANNLYGAIKEIKDVGFEAFSLVRLNRPIDVMDEESLAQLYNELLNSVKTIINSALDLNYTVQDSQAAIPDFLTSYSNAMSEELSNILQVLTVNDSSLLTRQFWGWTGFFRKYKVNTIRDMSKLLRLVSTHYDAKTHLAMRTDRPLESLEQLLALESEYIQSDIPLAQWDAPPLNDLIRLTPNNVTIIVGAAGIGKTSVGGALAGLWMAQGKKVMFYCPEITKHHLLHNYVLPSYIHSTCGFKVTVQQILGLEPPYEFGSDLTPEEKADAIRLAKLKFAESGVFYHVATNYQLRSLESTMRSQLIEFEPDFVIFDHTTEVDGEPNLNIVTDTLARVLKKLKKEFNTHFIILSHTGSDFSTPTSTVPIVTKKIVAWSKSLEGAADNVTGLFMANNCLNMFFTKLRWHKLVPMYLVFRLDRTHGLVEFRTNDQLSAVSEQDEMARLSNILQGNAVFEADDVADDEEEYSGGFTIGG